MAWSKIKNNLYIVKEKQGTGSGLLKIDMIPGSKIKGFPDFKDRYIVRILKYGKIKSKQFTSKKKALEYAKRYMKNNLRG